MSEGLVGVHTAVLFLLATRSLGSRYVCEEEEERLTVMAVICNEIVIAGIQTLGI